MTQQLLYQAINSMLGATLNISAELGESQARSVRGNVTLLQQASERAWRCQDARQLRKLCDEVARLGEDVKVLLGA